MKDKLPLEKSPVPFTLFPGSRVLIHYFFRCIKRCAIIRAMFPKILIPILIIAIPHACLAQTGDDITEQFELKKVSIKGNKVFSDREIINMIGLEKGTVYERYLFDFYLEAGLRTVKLRYFREGYESARVRWAFKDIKETSRKMQVEVEEGERAAISDISIIGVAEGDYSEILQQMEVHPGAPLAEGLVAKGAGHIATYYLNRGFADVAIRYDIDRENATVTYNVVEGKEFRIDNIVISGNINTRGEIIRREVKLKKGDLYNQQLIEESRKGIYGTRLYRQVLIEPYTSSESDDMKTLSILVEEDKPRWFEINPGYSSPDRIRLAGKWGHNNFLSNNNNRLMYEGDLSYGFTDKRFRGQTSLTYTEPWLLGYKYKGEIEGSAKREVYSDFRYWEMAVEARVSKDLSKTIEVGGGYEYKLVNFIFGPLFVKELGGKLDEGIAEEDLTPNESKERLLTILADAGYFDIFTGKIYIKYSSTDDEWNPLSGYYVYLSQELMGGIFPGDVDAYRIIGDVRKFIPIAEKASMGFRLRSGYVHEFGETKEVPYSERFFTGGAFSVRGFGEQQLGPKDVTGEPAGARILGLGNVEFRFQLPFVDGAVIPGLKLDLSPVWGGLFFDAGNVWNSYKEYRKENLRLGAGIGIRYVTPVGPVRLDYGREIALDNALDTNGMFYIAFGHAF